MRLWKAFLFVHLLFRRKQYGDLRIYIENQCVCVLGEYRALYFFKTRLDQWFPNSCHWTSEELATVKVR